MTCAGLSLLNRVSKSKKTRKIKTVAISAGIKKKKKKICAFCIIILTLVRSGLLISCKMQLTLSPSPCALPAGKVQLA